MLLACFRHNMRLPCPSPCWCGQFATYVTLQSHSKRVLLHALTSHVHRRVRTAGQQRPYLQSACLPAGLVIFSFLVVEPSDVGFAPQSGSVMGSIVSVHLPPPATLPAALTVPGSAAATSRLQARVASAHRFLVNVRLQWTQPGADAVSLGGWCQLLARKVLPPSLRHALPYLAVQSGSGVQTPRSEASVSEADEAQHYLERHLARVAAGRGGGLVPAQIAEQLGE